MAAPKSWTEASPLVSAQRSINATSRMALLKKVGPALLGNMIEFYEFGIYALVSEAISDNFFATSAEHEYGVWFGFAISFIARPFGGAVFGWVADRISRRVSLLMSVFGMIVSTAAIGMLPSYQWGGPVAGRIGWFFLFVCKLIQGLSIGGELTTLYVFAVEHAGPRMCGFALGLCSATASFGTVIAELVIALLDLATTEEQLNSWAWRIPFLITLPVTAAQFGAILRAILRNAL